MRVIYDDLLRLEGHLFTTAEAAEIMHIGERSVRRVIEEDKLEAVEFKGRYLIAFDAIQDYARHYDAELFAEAGEAARGAVRTALHLEFDHDALIPRKRRLGR